jgi:hypothetical protein
MTTISKIVAALFAIFFVASFVFWGVNGVINYSASFVSFLLIAVASFVGYRRMVFASNDVLPVEEDDEEEDEVKQSKMSVLLKTYKGWIFPFRLASYAVFVLVFLYFANNGLLNIFAFLTGIAVLPIAALVFTLFFRREFD